MASFHTHILGVGHYLPQRIMTNYHLEQTLDTSHEWIVERTGIQSRHIAAEEEELTSHLAIGAAKEALERANIEPEALDLIILATCTPDHTFPATATRIQQELKATNAVAFDVGAACTGYIMALSIANAYITTGMARQALILGAETLSRIVNWQDRTTAVLFGDGAGAMILKGVASKLNGEESPLHKQGFLSQSLGTNGEGYRLLGVSGGPSSSKTSGFIHMQGPEVFKHAVTTFAQSLRDAASKACIALEDIDYFIPHQANSRIIQAVCQRLHIPLEKFIQTGKFHGNTSAASIPLAFYQGVQDGRLKPGQLLALTAFGAGFTWGSIILRY